MPEFPIDFLDNLYQNFLGNTIRVAPIYLVATVLIAYLIYLIRKVDIPFRQWILPTEIVRSKSSLTDVKLFFGGRLFALTGFLGSVTITTATATMIFVALGGKMSASDLHPLAIAFLVMLVSDFSVYWIHRIHHEQPVLWPFHSVHHSAEVLSPITVYRKHPIYDIFAALLRSVLIGALQGLLLALFTDTITASQIAGINVFYFLFNILGSNFRHSHIWISYGRVLEHILISPAQHQIHHSRAVKHHDKNYGEILAVWDWMFGTLYIPDAYEKLDFGLSDREGVPTPQPHNGFWQAIYVPFVESWNAIVRNRTPEAKPEPTVSSTVEH